MTENNTVNVRVEHDPAPIRHIAVQCPDCKRWFYGSDITSDDLGYDYQIGYATFTCPECNHVFGNIGRYSVPKVKIEEVGFPDVYAECVTY